jgi:hypothetical protein
MKLEIKTRYGKLYFDPDSNKNPCEFLTTSGEWCIGNIEKVLLDLGRPVGVYITPPDGIAYWASREVRPVQEKKFQTVKMDINEIAEICRTKWLRLRNGSSALLFNPSLTLRANGAIVVSGSWMLEDCQWAHSPNSTEWKDFTKQVEV